MKLYNKYIKYKKKYLSLKNQLGGLIDCDDKYYFFENFQGTCWMISILMILFSHEPQLLEKLMTMKKDDYIEKFFNSNTKIFFPHFTKLTIVDNIVSFFNYLKKRFENRKQYNEKSFNDTEKTCELELLKLFSAVYYKNYTFNDYLGGNVYNEFFLVLLISYFLSEKLYSHSIYVIDNIINKMIDLSNIIGIRLGAMSLIHEAHSMCFYKCKDKLMFCSNEYKIEYNWIKLFEKINELNKKSIKAHLYLYNNKQELDVMLLYNIEDKFYEYKIESGDNLLLNNHRNIDNYVSNKYMVVGELAIINEFNSNMSNYMTRHFNKFLPMYLNYNNVYTDTIISKYYKPHFQDTEGKTALFSLIQYKFKLLTDYKSNIAIIDVFKKLINNNINIVDNLGRTILMYCILFNDIESLKILLEQRNIKIDIQEDHGDTALMMAVKENNVTMVKLLLNNKADVDIKDMRNGTPIVVAAIKNNIEIIKLLLEKRPKYNIDIALEIVDEQIKKLRDIDNNVNDDLKKYNEIKKLLLLI